MTAFLALGSCAAQKVTDDDGGELTGAPEDERGAESVYPAGSKLRATANVNLRKSASTGYAILHVIPKGSTVTVTAAGTKGRWIGVRHTGQEGFAYSTYFELVSAPPSSGTDAGVVADAGGSSADAAAPDADAGVVDGGASPSPSARDAAIALAKTGVGFSYWWGHGRWLPGGPTSSTKGTCSGSCPSCSHSGSYGADCSGYIAKIWKVPAGNTDITVDAHPYSTADFVADSSYWSTVSRGTLRPADSLVYRSGGAGHIALYESGDGWGASWTYEARGCSYGIVHNLRTFGSEYKGIARKGW